MKEAIEIVDELLVNKVRHGVPARVVAQLERLREKLVAPKAKKAE